VASSAAVERAALIVNPFASAVEEEQLAEVERELRRSYELDVQLTERRDHATELAGEVAAKTVFVYGGDGLLNEVLNGIGVDVAVGALPGGGTNVVARSLRLPLDPVAAADALRHGRPRRISVGSVNGRRFAFAGGIGLDAELIRRVDALGRSRDGRRPGDAAFVWQAAKLLARRRGSYEPALEIEGLGRAAFVLVANSDPYTYAAGLPLHVAPEARFELGLDLVAPRRVTARTIPRLLGYLIRGRGQEEARDIIYGHDLDRLQIRCDRPLPLQVDGEDLGDVEEATFQAERNAVTLLEPPGTLQA
jgi:diacylglycerol kinase family enzyme